MENLKEVIAAYRWIPVDDDGLPLFCEVCGEDQFLELHGSGVTCSNGHGGSEGIPRKNWSSCVFKRLLVKAEPNFEALRELKETLEKVSFPFDDKEAISQYLDAARLAERLRRSLLKQLIHHMKGP